MDSIIMAHQIRTISKQRLKGLLGYLEDPSFGTKCVQLSRNIWDLIGSLYYLNGGPLWIRTTDPSLIRTVL